MSTRVLLDSQGINPPEQLVAVVGFTPFGEGETALTGALQEVTLTFFANYMAAARKPTQDFKAFAKLSDKARSLPDGTIEFASKGKAEALHGEPEGATRTVLTLVGASDEVTFEKPQLELPTPPEDARYMEIAVEFKVGNVVEATFQHNDYLDLNAFRSVDISLKDEADNAVPFERFVVKDKTGAVIEGTLDAEGQARVSGLRTIECDVEFPDTERVDLVTV